MIADPDASNLDALLARIYELYADYVLKNPFYALDMPIRCDLFETQLVQLVQGPEFAK